MRNSGTIVSVETANYSPNGKIQWEKRFSLPGCHYQGGTDIDLDHEGNIYVTGYSDVGGKNYYKLVWFDPNGFESNAVLALAIDESGPRLFSNSATNRVKVVLKELEQNNGVLTVIDQYGRFRSTRKIQKGTVPELIVASLPVGIYYIQVDLNENRFRQKLLKN